MKVGCITRHLYPTGQEIRVTKLGSTVHSAGHEFYVFCPGARDQPIRQPFEFGVSIRLRPFLPGFLGKLICAPIPINPIWVGWLLMQFKRIQLDVLVVRDLRLAWPAYAAAKIARIKVILDLGEHYPGMMKISGKQNLTHYMTRNAWLIERLEASSVKWAHQVWVVVEENKARLATYSDHIEVIHNYPALKPGMGIEPKSQTPYTSGGPPVTLISLGLIDNIRGIDLAINALSLILKKLSNVQLRIYGDGYFRPVLEKQVHDLKLESNVLFGGWVKDAEKYAVLSHGDIGLVLHKVCDLTQHTMPNKVFDYMSMGLPVVSTKLNPVTRVLEKENAGISVDETQEAVAREISNLIQDYDRRKRFGRNGYNAMRGSSYAWEHEAMKIMANLHHLRSQC